MVIAAHSVNTITWSDHVPVSITINSSSAFNPTKCWRANAHVLQTSPYAEKICNTLQTFLCGSVPHLSTLWMVHKAFIRGILIQMSSLAKKMRTQHLDELTTDISNSELQNKNNPTHKLEIKLLALRQELGALLLCRIHTNGFSDGECWM